MKITWASDIHLDHAEDVPNSFSDFAKSVREAASDVLIITGDISTGIGFEPHIRELASAVGNILWVRGNHDLWRTSTDAANDQDRYLTSVLAGGGSADLWGSLHTKDEVTMVGDSTCILGVNGWYDFNAGEMHRAPIIMNDWHRIADFVEGIYKGETERTLSLRLSGRDTVSALLKLNSAYEKGVRQFHLFTHVPQFSATCSYRGRPTNPADLGLYCNTSFGISLKEWCFNHPDANLTTYAGHTHFGKDVQIAPNLIARVAPAQYGSPKIASILEIK